MKIFKNFKKHFTETKSLNKIKKHRFLLNLASVYIILLLAIFLTRNFLFKYCYDFNTVNYNLTYYKKLHCFKIKSIEKINISCNNITKLTISNSMNPTIFKVLSAGS